MRHIFHWLGACILVALWGPASLVAAVPGSGTLSPPTASISWSGGPYTAVTADPAACTALTCDNFTLTINIPASYYVSYPTYSVRVGISWESLPNDFDLYLYDANGALVNSSASGGTTAEGVDLGQLTTGTFNVQIVAFSTVNESYSGLATLAATPAAGVRSGNYKVGNFSFTTPQALPGPDDLLFGNQGIEPRCAFDALGNIYAAAIQGIPAGTDVWKSTNGGTSFTYLGQPDGLQAGSAVARGGGVGGGDEDIAIGASGNVYVTSLWLGSATQSSSTNGGATWLANPVSTDVPGADRQWIAAHGNNELYLTYKQLGADLGGTESILVVKSTDGGITFPQVAQVTTPELGVQPGDQGNIVVDQKNGYVYTVFVGASSPNQLYVARSTDGGKTFILKLAFDGPSGWSLTNVFPIIAVDRGSNVHIVFSNGTNIFLTSSSNQGASWTVPVRINNGTGTKTSLSPWVDAGDAGKLDITWWGTSSANSLSDTAQWKVYFAQTQNAFAKIPAFSEGPATGVIHTGAICVNGTGCASGTRNLAEYFANTVYLDGMSMIVYPDDQHSASPLTYFTKQSGGAGVLSTKKAVTALQTDRPRDGAGVAPVQYGLDQNHPNPFNPTTRVSYALPEEATVVLKVYNTLGQEVKLLVNGVEAAGYKSVSFDASGLPSGVYFYRIQATPLRDGAPEVSREFVEVKKMILMR